MTERRGNGEVKLGREWILFGKAPGLKTQDLINFSRSTPYGVQVLAGIGIGASLFDETLLTNNLPASYLKVNKEITDILPIGVPVAVRSSAKDEGGGTGVYYSGFIVPTGNAQIDKTNLEKEEKAVYASYFTDEAKAYRQGADASGMAVLIQPVIGDTYDDYFMPAFSGVMTMIDGKPTLRLVIGLGTKAVDMDEAIVLSNNQISVDEIAERLDSLKQADAINLLSGEVEKTIITNQTRERVLNQISKLKLLIDAYNNNPQPYYWEFAVDESSEFPYIVQSAPEHQKDIKLEFDQPEGAIIYEGEDTVNTGVKRGRGIIIIGAQGGFSGDELNIFKAINEQNQDFLLVLPDTVFTRAGGRDQLINLSHFSNASGVVEIQIPKTSQAIGVPVTIDHTHKRGGAHFSELCKRKDILFLGVQPEEAYGDVKRLGEATERIGHGSSFYDIDYKMTNTPDGGRVEILGSQRLREYTVSQLNEWSDEIYHLASSLTDGGDKKDAKIGRAFFTVLYDCIVEAWTRGKWDLVNFDPFKFIEKSTKEDMPNLIKQIQISRKNLWMLDSYADYEQAKEWGVEEDYFLDKYLQKAVSLLEEKLKT
jgi:hypothetical protein